MSESIRFAIAGVLIGAIGAAIAVMLWRVGGIVLLMIGGILLVAARTRSHGWK